MKKNELELCERWNNICNEYLLKFCNKHEYSYEPDMWVGSDPGTIAMIGDMFVSMNDIRYDIDCNIPEETFEKWYWKSVDVYELTNIHYMNYESYCHGAPDEWTEARMQAIHDAKTKIETAKAEFQKLIDETQENKNIF